MIATIYSPSRTAMQSGQAATRQWILKFDAKNARFIEPLMGWTSSSDTSQQVVLRFETKDEAIAYAQSKGLAYRVEEPQQPLRRRLSYSDNFSYSRATPWSH